MRLPRFTLPRLATVDRYLTPVCVIIGITAIAAGASMIFVPAGVIAGGVGLVALGIWGTR